MILSLLKGYLLSDCTGLVSHELLSKGIGIYAIGAFVVAYGILMNRMFRLLVSKRYSMGSYVFY
jgi:hypothetical protein